MEAVRVLLLLCIAMLAGCAAPPETDEPLAPVLTGGDFTGSLMHDGQNRSHLVHVPDGERRGLLLMLHGGVGTPAQFQQDSGMDAHADRRGFMVVYPEGIGRSWNAAHCCGTAHSQDIDDVGYLEALIDHLEITYGLDGPIGVAGHSNGAMMAYRLAAQSARIDMVAAVAGAIGGQTTPLSDSVTIPAPARPLDVLILHARDDDHVAYEGGRSQGLSPLRIDASVQDAITLWTQAGRAAEAASWQAGADWTRYDGDATVLVGITQGGHGWPGSQAPAWRQALVSAPATPDASAEIAAFFATQW